MKKLKYLFTFLVTLCFVPNIVNAAQKVNYKAYEIGDEITVTLDKAGKVKGKFRVIASSSSGIEYNVPDDYTPGTAAYQYVTAIYEGTLGNSIYATSEDATYKTSTARSNLTTKAKENGWVNQEEITLISSADISVLRKAMPQPENGVMISESDFKKYYPWMFLDKSYWMQSNVITATPSCPPGYGCVQVIITGAYAIAPDYTGSLTPIGSELALRPVITIHKGYVEDGMICNGESCGITLEKEENNSTQPGTNDTGKEENNSTQPGTNDTGKEENSSTKPGTGGTEKEENNSTQPGTNDTEKEENNSTQLGTTTKHCPNDASIDITSCITSGKTEELCIKKLCPGTEKIENPKTGSYFIGILLAGMIAGIMYICTKRKNYFRKIK